MSAIRPIRNGRREAPSFWSCLCWTISLAMAMTLQADSDPFGRRSALQRHVAVSAALPAGEAGLDQGLWVEKAEQRAGDITA